MKNIKILIAVFTFCLFFAACKGSKCDCPSFKPKSEVQDLAPTYAVVNNLYYS